MDDGIPADCSYWILEDLVADAATEMFADFLGLEKFPFVSDAGQVHLIDH